MSPLSGVTLAFDLDGTLVDTAPDLVGALNAVLAEQGLAPVALETARLMVGHGARALIAKGYAASGLTVPAELAEGLFLRFIDLYLARIALESRPFEGLVPVLEDLSAQGAILCVCTNKPTLLAQRLLDELGLAHHFAAVVGPDAALAAKPDARHLLYAVEKSGGEIAYTVMIGDSATDVGVARNARVPVIVTSFGYTDIAPRDLGADAVIDSFAELSDALHVLLESAP